MKKLIIVRHGEAESYAATDYERRLTEKGIERMEETTKQLEEVLPEDNTRLKISASAAARTAESAEVIAGEIGYPEEKVETMKSLYNGDANHYLNYIAVTCDEVDCLMIVGHNPAVSKLTAGFMDGGMSPMRKGAAAVFEFDMPRWEEIFITPGELIQFVV